MEEEVTRIVRELAVVEVVWSMVVVVEAGTVAVGMVVVGEDVSTAAAGSEAMAGEDEGGTGGGAGRVVSVIVVAVDVKVGGCEVEVEGRNCRGGYGGGGGGRVGG